mmetsp:Transcript_222/g.483  ORF Transcript_222/g.483 Transcript_222/m.483 type:complete len:361 (+) Transcript_222:56-1138(+)
MVASMVRSVRRWAQVTMAVLAITAVATVVALCVLRRHPEASSAAAIHETLQLEAALPISAYTPVSTLPPPTTSSPLLPLASTTKAASNIEDNDAPVRGGLFHRLLRFIALTICMIFIICIQLCCYLRSSHEPADIEEGLKADPVIVQGDLWGPRLLLTQVMKFIELCGFEARNAYVSGDGNFYIDERSDCPQRCCASVNRELTLFGHAGPSEEAPVVLRMFKPYHLQGCCFCRPEMHIDVPMGDQMVNVGKIEDPCKCCVVNQLVLGSNEQRRYEVTGPVCQCGACCPCCADFNFDINDQSGATVGTITKKKLSLKECCTKTNRFEVDFPKQCTMDDKRLLVGSAMLLDLQYFEQNKNNN